MIVSSSPLVFLPKIDRVFYPEISSIDIKVQLAFHFPPHPRKKHQLLNNLINESAPAVNSQGWFEWNWQSRIPENAEVHTIKLIYCTTPSDGNLLYIWAHTSTIHFCMAMKNLQRDNEWILKQVRIHHSMKHVCCWIIRTRRKQWVWFVKCNCLYIFLMVPVSKVNKEKLLRNIFNFFEKRKKRNANSW